MCKAKHYSEDLLTIYNNVISEFNKLVNELSQADLYEQDVLHMIENRNFNASEGYKLSKMLHDNRKKRREIKNELEPLKMLKGSFIDTSIKALNNAHQAVVRKDNILTNLTENKVYAQRVIGKEQNSTSQQNSFIPIPIPVTPVTQKEQVTIIGNAIHKKTNEKLKVISKLDDAHYFIVRRDGRKEIINTKNIINFEYLQSAK